MLTPRSTLQYKVKISLLVSGEAMLYAALNKKGYDHHNWCSLPEGRGTVRSVPWVIILVGRNHAAIHVTLSTTGRLMFSVR